MTTALRCPRCDEALETAGGTGPVLDRCPCCGGLFVEVREVAAIAATGLPYAPLSLEPRLQGAMVGAGRALLAARAGAVLAARVLLRR